METEHKLNEKQGHWILAKLGKKVLRPGGRKLTEELVKSLKISKEDNVVEFAPGLGFTANILCSYTPKSYTGVDLNQEAARLAQKNIRYQNAKILVANASNTTLPEEFADKVCGEAMLTMQPLAQKKAIIKEAFRILKSGGYYGIHELSLVPDDVSDSVKEEIFKGLGASIRVHARPMTALEWTTLLEEEGFEVIKIAHSPMLLLEGKRILEDEGLFRTLKFTFNLLIYSDLRKRVLQMRNVFRKYNEHLGAVAIIARKK